MEFGGSGTWALDMQLRGLGEAKKQHRATLYVGTTKVIDLHLKGQLFALSASPTLAREANGWAAAWEQWHNDRWFADQRAEVDNYLQVVIEKIIRKGTYIEEEGMVQAAIGRFGATDFTVIDREAIVSFSSPQEKDACKSELAARWLNALHRADPPAWWKTKPTKLGDECDVLAVSNRGEVLAIEVKPHTASDRDIAWSVLHGMYADLFQRWADSAGGKAHEVLHGMAAQRNRIGLSTGPRNSGRRTHQGTPRRRTRPPSHSKREKEAGGSVRAPGFHRYCNRP